jgi:hypothetical protein
VENINDFNGKWLACSLQWLLACDMELENDAGFRVHGSPRWRA